MYKIEEGKEFPDPVKGRIKYPLQDMAIGETFDVPLKGTTIERVRAAIHTSAHRRFPEKKFATRHIKAKDILRCKRIE